MVRDLSAGDSTGVRGRMILDLSLVVVYTLFAYAVILFSMGGDAVSTIVGAAFVLFVPGYAFVAALFPERPARATDSDDQGLAPDRRRIDWMERVALSFVTSILVVTILSFLLDVSRIGIQPEPFIRGLSTFTLASTVVAAIRRWALPGERRFVLPVKAWIAATRETLWSPGSPLEMTMHGVVVCALLVGVVSAGYAVSIPQSGESFTEFYVLTEDEDGNLVAGEYPTDVVEGEQRELVVGVGNQERQREQYSIIVRLQRTDPADSSVVKEQVIDVRGVGPLSHNETEHQRVAFSPELTGEQVRLQFLLFRGSPPDQPSTDDAYRDLHIWLTVAPAENESTVRGDSQLLD